MPRTRRTLSGDRALPQPGSTPGVRYGEGQDLQRLAGQMPAPAAPAAGSGSPPAASPSAATGPSAGAPDLAAQLAALPRPGLLRAPSTRPTEPGTAGLSVGPGPGPEIMPAGPSEAPNVRFLRELAAITGRTYFDDLARRLTR